LDQSEGMSDKKSQLNSERIHNVVCRFRYVAGGVGANYSVITMEKVVTN